MSRASTFLLTLLAMIAFAGNSLLCRAALKHTGIDAASFTAIRIAAGALVLWIIVRLRGGSWRTTGGSWRSALALFAYAACFSYAYIGLSAATGALLLFGAVQATMIGVGLSRGERFHLAQAVGLSIAFVGLAALQLPSASTPPMTASMLMLAAGCAWGIYSLRGKGVSDPTSATAGNFLRAVPMAVVLSLASLRAVNVDREGVCYAIVSGALTSGVGYAIWYTALRGLKATSAAVVQLSVPVIAAMGGVALFGEAISLRLLIASVAILGGIGLVIFERSNRQPQN